MSDFIQETVNKANDESLERYKKVIRRAIERSNHHHNLIRKKRKLERKNRRVGRR